MNTPALDNSEESVTRELGPEVHLPFNLEIEKELPSFRMDLLIHCCLAVSLPYSAMKFCTTSINSSASSKCGM